MDAQQRIADLEREIDSAIDATGIAGVDAPMNLGECIAALRLQRDELRAHAQTVKEAGEVLIKRWQERLYMPEPFKEATLSMIKAATEWKP